MGARKLERKIVRRGAKFRQLLRMRRDVARRWDPQRGVLRPHRPPLGKLRDM